MLNEWIKRMCVYYSALMKNEILLCTTAQMDLECIKLSEINQMKKDTVISLTCEILKKKKTKSNTNAKTKQKNISKSWRTY